MREYCRADNIMSSVFCGNNFAIAESSSSGVFFTKGEKAYTKDNKVIYTICVYSIPKQFTAVDIYCYFCKFGVVSYVRLVNDKKRCDRAPSTVGFVNFAEPEGAYRALREPSHNIQGSRLDVKAGDSWNQPNAEKTCIEKKPGAEVVCNTKQREDEALNINAKCAGMNVLSLNDDCLEIICGQLGLRDQIRFARVCERFQEIFKMLSRRKYKRLDLYTIKRMQLSEAEDFFRFAGESIEEVSGDIPYNNPECIISFIMTFCVNLKCLTLREIIMDHDYLEKLFRSFPLLRELHLYGSDLEDISIQPLQYLKQLECLSLCENKKITGRFISALVQLKVLSLYDCREIPPSTLVEICHSMPNLQSLDIRHCEQLAAIFFNSLAEHCKQLEILKISCPDISYERILFSPRLKHIELLLRTSAPVSHTQIFFELAENKSQQLETLKIFGKNSINYQQISLIAKLKKLKSFYCTNNQAIDDGALLNFCKLEQLEELIIKKCDGVTNWALIKLLRSCKRLRHINIEFCKKITNEFVLEAINLLKDRLDRSQTPLVIFAYGTSIDKSGFSKYQKYNVAEKESLNKVMFDISRVNVGFGVNQIYDLWDSEGWSDDGDDDDLYSSDTDVDERFPYGRLFF